MKTLINKFNKWMNSDPLTEKWESRGWSVAKVEITLSDGSKRTLIGADADVWYKSIWMAICGRRGQNWNAHRWTITKS
jgi:hypothetical protein